MAARYTAGTLTAKEQQNIAAIEKGWEACGGDLKKFCQRTGISADLVPDIELALEAASSEGDMAAATDAVIEKLAGHLRG